MAIICRDESQWSCRVSILSLEARAMWRLWNGCARSGSRARATQKTTRLSKIGGGGWGIGSPLRVRFAIVCQRWPFHLSQLSYKGIRPLQPSGASFSRTAGFVGGMPPCTIGLGAGLTSGMWAGFDWIAWKSAQSPGIWTWGGWGCNQEAAVRFLAGLFIFRPNGSGFLFSRCRPADWLLGLGLFYRPLCCLRGEAFRFICKTLPTEPSAIGMDGSPQPTRVHSLSIPGRSH